MTVAAPIRQSFFDLHGVVVDVRAQDRAVIEAIELRLRDFRTATTTESEVRFEFIADGLGDPALPAGAARPVYDTPHGTLHYFPDADLLSGRLGGVALRCEAGRGAAVFHGRAYAGRDLYLATHPLATICLMELLERRGRFALHAACLAGEDARGVLLAGASGAGKSTLALSLAREGLHFLSDDIAFLAGGEDAGQVRVLGFADTVGVTEFAAARFPELRELLAEPPATGFPKRLHRIEDLWGVPALASCRPGALVFPEITHDAPSEIAPLDPGDAMLRLVPDVLLTDPAATQAHLRAIAALLGQVRCYALRSGPDLERAVALVQALI